MTKRLNELRQKRGELVHEARQLNEKAGEEKRSMTDEERSKFDTIMADVGKVKDEITREESLIEEERALAGAAAPQGGEGGGGEHRGEQQTDEQRQLGAFRSFLAGGVSEMTQDERRDLQVTDSTKGGNIVAPQVFVATLIKDLDDMLHIRRRANVITQAGPNGIGAPTLDADPDDGDWTTELATGSEDDTMRFGKRNMEPHPMAKRIKVSNDLLRAPGMNAEDIVRMRLRYKFAVTMEKAYMTGSGSNQPLGLFTASSSGVPTSRDVATGNTTTAIGADNIIATKYSLKQQYRANASWLFHRDGISQIAQLKDNDDQYLWRPGLREGEPDTLAGLPIDESEYAPNTFTTGQYVGLLGDMNFYWILDDLAMTIQRLVELYAENNQTGFIGRYQGDGAPVLAEAFARVKLA